MSADDEILDQMLGIKPPPPPEATAGNRLKRLDAKYRAPERLTKLAPEHKLMIEYMVYGISSPVRARQLNVGADIPLDFKTAADASRVRRRAARRLINDELFRAALAKEIRGYREGLAGEATRTIAAVMTDAGDGTAADRKVQLQAATTLLGENRTGGPTVNVNIDNRQTLQAGIVVRLPASSKVTPGETAKLVEGVEQPTAPPSHVLRRDIETQTMRAVSVDNKP